MEFNNNRDNWKDQDKFAMMREEYNKFKNHFGENMVFDTSAGFTTNYSKILEQSSSYPYFIISASMKRTDLYVVQIYFDTATFDQIESDVQITIESSVGLVGGTMGLFTGFSILSGVETIYFMAKLVCAWIAKKRSKKCKKDKNDQQI